MSEMPPTVPPATPPPGGGSYTPPPPPAGGGPVSSDRTLMLILSYLWLLCLIPLITKKEDREIQWHAKNGLALMIAEVVLWIILFVVGFFMPDIVGCGLATVQCVLWLGIVVLHIIAMMKALKGERLRIPMVSDFADKM